MTDVNQHVTQHMDIWTSAIEKKSNAGRGSDSGSGSGSGLSLYGVKKLRNLILELGVRGRLVPQFEHEGTGQALLTKILRQRANLEKKKLVRPKSASSRYYKDWPFSLPDNWTWTTLSQASDFRPGKTPSTKNSTYWSSEGTGYPWVSISDLVVNGSVISTTKEVTETAHRDVFKGEMVPAGTLLMSFKLTIGKTSFLDIDAFHNEAIIGINPLEGVSKDYLFRFLPLLSSFASDKAAIKGNTLNAGSLALLPVPLPPLDEQHRIVAKVDELMALCDSLERQTEDGLKAHQTLVETCLANLTNSQSSEELTRNWTRIEANFDTLFTTEESLEALLQSILDLAVSGRLVPQKTKDESASVFLDAVERKRAELIDRGIAKKSKNSARDQGTNLLGNLPESWLWVPISELALVGTGATPSRTRSDYFNPAEVSWVTSGETSQDFILETGERISALAVKETNVSVYPPGTLVIAMYGQGKTRGQITELRIEAGTNQACAALQMFCSDENHKKYIKLFFQKAYHELRAQAEGGAQPNLNLGKISATQIPLPPLEEQCRIVARFEELSKLLKLSTKKIKEKNELKTQLANTLTSKIH